MNLLELVPRDLYSLKTEVHHLLNRFPQLSGINIPDVLRLPTRSTDAVYSLLSENILAIPHIRAIDLPLETSINNIKNLVKKGLTHILIISGDIPQKPNQELYNVTPTQLIKTLAAELPNLKIYAGLDPYRQSFKEEFAYCQEKLDAGANGFFTQPFFDPHLAEIFLDQFKTCEIFIGISPVLTETSLHYWTEKNNAIFPSDFVPNLNHSISIAKKLTALANTYKQSTYHMPIKVDPELYLEGVFKD
ncbi:MAG: methylenetetrahydrofolate reductase [Candidatus Margulisbacteria bacterium]|nr:methylenetetrahydrofolate reductase [Candidatus Margulisiibacteriota bacterium]